MEVKNERTDFSIASYLSWIDAAHIDRASPECARHSSPGSKPEAENGDFKIGLSCGLRGDNLSWRQGIDLSKLHFSTVTSP
jgi:hypothetical protein